MEGSSFGRNVLAGLPDVIGQVLGRALVGVGQGGGNGAAETVARQVDANARATSSDQPLEVQPTEGDIIIVSASSRSLPTFQPFNFNLFATAYRVNPHGPYDMPSNEQLRRFLEERSIQQGQPESNAPGLRKIIPWLKRGSALTMLRTAESVADATLPTVEIPLASDGQLVIDTLIGSFSTGRINRINADGTREYIGGILHGDLEHIGFINTLEWNPGEFESTGHNAVVFTDVDGQKVGFGVSINTRREAEIYNDGIAGGLSSDEINQRIAFERQAADSGAIQSRDSHIAIRYGVTSPPEGFESIGRNRVTFGGFEVRAVRDLSGLSEGSLVYMMQRGTAPYIRGLGVIDLHHHLQNPVGPIVELPSSVHSIRNRNQHPFGNTRGAGLSADQRADFNVWRTSYWQARAQAELYRRSQVQ